MSALHVASQPGPPLWTSLPYTGLHQPHITCSSTHNVAKRLPALILRQSVDLTPPPSLRPSPPPFPSLACRTLHCEDSSPRAGRLVTQHLNSWSHASMNLGFALSGGWPRGRASQRLQRGEPAEGRGRRAGQQGVVAGGRGSCSHVRGSQAVVPCRTHGSLAHARKSCGVVGDHFWHGGDQVAACLP